MKAFWLSSTAFLALLVVTTYWPTKMRVQRLSEHEARLREQIQTLERENRELRQRLEAIRQDPHYLERWVRHEFGWVRAGETVVR